MLSSHMNEKKGNTQPEPFGFISIASSFCRLTSWAIVASHTVRLRGIVGCDATAADNHEPWTLSNDRRGGAT